MKMIARFITVLIFGTGLLFAFVSAQPDIAGKQWAFKPFQSVLAAFKPSSAEKQSGEYTFKTKRLSRGKVRKVVKTSGAVKPLVSVEIGSEISGRIKELRADFNDKVKSGDILAIIDPKTFRSKFKQAQADLDAAKASLVNHEVSTRKAKAVLKNAIDIYRRQKTLTRKGLTEASKFSNARRDLEIARADIDVVKAKIANAQAVVAQKSAQVEQAEIDLDRTTIRTPIDGIVISRTVDVGQTVAASLKAPELFRIADDLQKMNIEAQVNETEIGFVRTGNPVVFYVDAHPEQKFKGRVAQVRLAPEVDKSVVTYTVIIEADNSAGELFPGMTANVTIETAKLKNTLRIRTAALRYKPPRKILESVKNTIDQRKRLTRMVSRLGSKLNLSSSQIATLEKTISDGSADSGKSKSEIAYLKSIVTPVLNAEQLPQFAVWSKSMTKARKASVWVLSPRGVPQQRYVYVGLFDEKYAEFRDGDVDKDDLVIVRSRKVKKK